MSIGWGGWQEEHLDDVPPHSTIQDFHNRDHVTMGKSH